MKFTKSKSTKRFNFTVSRNTTSHQAGANTFTITSEGYSKSPDQRGYSSGTTTPTSVTMTYKEAQALNRFLNQYLVGFSKSS